MAIIERVRDVETPQIKFELPRVDMDKARSNMSKATLSMRDAVADRLPRRDPPSRAPYLIGGLLAGLSIGYFVATSEWFQPMVKDTVNQWRERMNGMRGSSAGDEFADVGVTYTEMTAVMEESTPTDTLSNDQSDAQQRSEESYAI